MSARTPDRGPATASAALPAGAAAMAPVAPVAPGLAPCRILHWSDPHFGAEDAAVLAAFERWAARARPTFMVLSGDITQRARREEFQAARGVIDRLQARSGAPWVALAGNHDLPLFNLLARAVWPLRNYRRAICGELEPVYADAFLRVACVHTARVWRHEDGAISCGQIDRVARYMAQAEPGQLRVVVTHQPVHVADAAERKNLIAGHARAVRHWARAGVDLILSGHIHLAYARALGPAPGGVLPEAWCVQAGTAFSSRVRREQPNSVNLVSYRPAGDRVPPGRWPPPLSVTVQQWDYLRPCDDFVLTRETELARPVSGPEVGLAIRSADGPPSSPESGLKGTQASPWSGSS